MAPMRRRPSGLLTVLSLSACVATSALWWWTADPSRAKSVWFERPGEWFALRAAEGQLAWVVPPPPTGSAAERAAAKTWIGNLEPFGQFVGSPVPLGPDGKDYPSSRVASLDQRFECVEHNYGELADRRRAYAVRPLVDALADPKRFLGAHVLLASRSGRLAATRADPRGGRFVGTVDGLEIDLGPEADWQHYDALDKFPPLTADPSQIPTLRRQWADRLAVPVAEIPLWALVLGLAVAPAVRLASALRVRVRRGSGRCAACGYDLRASPGRCPECGAMPSAAPAA
jgi:hypothetical protein